MRINNDTVLPYKVIAKFNGLTQEHDDNQELWIDTRGNKYVLTPLGFVLSVQYNQKILLDKMQSELENVSSALVASRKRFDEYRYAEFSPHKIVGKKLKKNVMALINNKGNNRTLDEILIEIKNYLV